MRYRGFDVLAFPTGFGSAAALGAVFYVHRRQVMVHHDVLPGPYTSSDEAVGAAEAAARRWIDEDGEPSTDCG
jgi:hypothetical protein